MTQDAFYVSRERTLYISDLVLNRNIIISARYCLVWFDKSS